MGFKERMLKGMSRGAVILEVLAEAALANHVLAELSPKQEEQRTRVRCSWLVPSRAVRRLVTGAVTPHRCKWYPKDLRRWNNEPQRLRRSRRNGHRSGCW